MISSIIEANNKLSLRADKNCCNTLIVDLSKNFGGATTRVLNLMQNMDHDRIALAALENSPVAIEAERAGLRVFVVGKNKGSLQILKSLISVIREGGFQVLDAQNPQAKFWGSIAAKLTGVALVSTLNSWYGSEHGEKSLKGRLYTMLELGTNFALDRYVVVSRSIYEALVRHGIQSDKIDLIHNAVEIQRSQNVGIGRDLIRTLNLPSEAIVLVAAGRLTWAKGYEDLISALKLVVEKDKRVYCLIAGEGELRQKLETQIESVGLTKHIFLLGHLPRVEVLSLIEAGDIFVMPSRSEGTPIALLEAAALRKPILSTSVGGIPELLKDGQECLLIPSPNLPELVNGIRKLILDKGLAEQLAKNAHRRVLQDFTLNAQALATIQSYNRAWKSRNGRLWRTTLY
jgi:glycosyltransferase involved in cell wall biosynthesis